MKIREIGIEGPSVQAYDERVDVYFQKKAWADKNFCRGEQEDTSKDGKSSYSVSNSLSHFL